jgi:hypothetical protein
MIAREWVCTDEVFGERGSLCSFDDALLGASNIDHKAKRARVLFEIAKHSGRSVAIDRDDGCRRAVKVIEITETLAHNAVAHRGLELITIAIEANDADARLSQPARY